MDLRQRLAQKAMSNILEVMWEPRYSCYVVLLMLAQVKPVPAQVNFTLGKTIWLSPSLNEMDESVRNEILSMSRNAHDLTEFAYQRNPSKSGDPDWAEKQRILLADMALHLLQTALKDGDLSEENLKRNLYSILTISDQFVRGHDLKAIADKLYAGPRIDSPGAG